MKIILFRGRPAVGKTTVSNAFAQKAHFPILRKDDVYDVASDFIAEHSIRNKVSYGVLHRILESNLNNDCTFIVDYPFQHEGEVGKFKKWCEEKCIAFKSILVTCSDEELWAHRLSERTKNPKPNQLITNFDELEKFYGTMQLIPEADELIVDTTMM